MRLLCVAHWRIWPFLAASGLGCTNHDGATAFPTGVGGQQGIGSSNIAPGSVNNGTSSGNDGSSLTGTSTSTNAGNGTSGNTASGTTNSSNSTGSTGNQTSSSTSSTGSSGNQTTSSTNSTSSTSKSTGTATSIATNGSTGTGAGGTGSIVVATGGSAGTTFIVPSDAAPTPTSSGIPGAFRVNTSTGKLMHNGTEFQVRGGNWFGLEGQDDNARPGAMELYIGAVFWASASDKRTIQQTMTEIKAAPLSLNTIRFPVAPQTLVKGHPDGLYSRTDVKIRNNDPTIYSYADSYEAMTDFLIQANKNDLNVILDMHSCSNHIGWRAGKVDDGPPWPDANRQNYQYKKENYYCNQGEDAYDVNKWLADIHTLAKLPKQLGIKNIIGIDCFNEPFKYSWSKWADLAKMCYDAIAAEDDDLIAIVEGVSASHESATAGVYDPEPYGDTDVNPNWGENLYGQQFDPIQIPKDRVCFSPHTYGPAVYVQKQFVDQSVPACVGLEDDAAGNAKCKLVVERSNAAAVAKLRRGWDQHFGYLVDQKYCVIIGEFGGYKNWPSNPVKPTAATIWAHLPTNVRYDWEWQNIFVDYMKSKGLTDFLYWSINPESGDTGGLYNHAYSLSNESGWGVWQGLDSEKAAMLQGLK